MNVFLLLLVYLNVPMAIYRKIKVEVTIISPNDITLGNLLFNANNKDTRTVKVKKGTRTM